MASAEIRMEGALAYAVGDLSRGFTQMLDQINMSRLSNGVKSAALMRRSLPEAIKAASRRVVSGRTVDSFPLARRQLLQMMVTPEQPLPSWVSSAAGMPRGAPLANRELGQAPGRGRGS